LHPAATLHHAFYADPLLCAAPTPPPSPLFTPRHLSRYPSHWIALAGAVGGPCVLPALAASSVCRPYIPRWPADLDALHRGLQRCRHLLPSLARLGALPATTSGDTGGSRGGSPRVSSPTQSQDGAGAAHMSTASRLFLSHLVGPSDGSRSPVTLPPRSRPTSASRDPRRTPPVPSGTELRGTGGRSVSPGAPATPLRRSRSSVSGSVGGEGPEGAHEQEDPLRGLEAAVASWGPDALLEQVGCRCRPVCHCCHGVLRTAEHVVGPVASLRLQCRHFCGSERRWWMLGCGWWSF
jgi:hypothetical protein